MKQSLTNVKCTDIALGCKHVFNTVNTKLGSTAVPEQGLNLDNCNYNFPAVTTVHYMYLCPTFVINKVKLHISTIFITFVMSCEVICCSVYFSLTKKLFFFMAEYSHGWYPPYVVHCHFPESKSGVECNWTGNCRWIA